MSLSISVVGPATEKLTTGPKSGSSRAVSTQKTPGFAMCCTAPSVARGPSRVDRERNARRTASSDWRSPATPGTPWSRTTGLRALMMTGKPISRAAFVAPAAVVTRRDSHSEIP